MNFVQLISCRVKCTDDMSCGISVYLCGDGADCADGCAGRKTVARLHELLEGLDIAKSMEERKKTVGSAVQNVLRTIPHEGESPVEDGFPH